MQSLWNVNVRRLELAKDLEKSFEVLNAILQFDCRSLYLAGFL